MTDAHAFAVEAIVDWVRRQADGVIEDGLSEPELDRAEEDFGVHFPPRWRAVLRRVHPVAGPEPPRGADGTRDWTAYPNWRRRDDAGTRELVERPVTGLLFDVEHNDFWWADWGRAPDDLARRLSVAVARLAEVPRLAPLWGHLYVASTDDSPVFSIVQADLYIPALSVADLVTGRSQDDVPLGDWPIGDVPFWSALHAYAQLGHQGPFADLGTGGL